MDELLTVVDEDNAPIGEALRSVVHRDGLWHRAVHIYYIRKRPDGFDVLVHLRAKDKVHCPNVWDTRFGGHVKASQQLMDAVKEELEEEIGLMVDIEQVVEGPVQRVTSHEGTNREFNHAYFYMGSEDTSRLTFQDREVQAVKWMSDRAILQSLDAEPDDWSTSREEFEPILAALSSLMSTL